MSASESQPLRRSSRLSNRPAPAPAPAPAKTKTAKVSKPASASSTKKSNGSSSAASSGVSLGASLPNVTLKNQDNEDVNLHDLAASGTTVVLFAYPKASTPGCTRQACSFRDRYSDFQKDASGTSKVAVFGISADSPGAQTTFKTKQNLPYDLLCDPEYKLLGPLGSKKEPKGVIRSHYVVKDGKFVVVARGVKPESSVGETLSAL